MKCEGGCGAETEGYNLFDYCVVCSANLCPKCMERGCCGDVPALSGQVTELDDDDYDEDGGNQDD